MTALFAFGAWGKPDIKQTSSNDRV
jgi:hypothetical protein